MAPDSKRIFVLATAADQPRRRGRPSRERYGYVVRHQALAAEYVLANARTLGKDVHRIPRELDREIARLKLQAMGTDIDTLTLEHRSISRRGTRARTDLVRSGSPTSGWIARPTRRS